MKYSLHPVLALVLACPIGTAAGLVKKTSAGICHPPESAYYERTRNYQTFDSIQECLASGGRLPVQFAADNLDLAETGSESYRRSAFGHGWNDSDVDCQNSRAEALIATSNTSVRFASNENCRVVSGRWISPFTGQIIQNSSNIDIDHVVPLKWAWEHGANNWSQSERERFANDMANLWPVEASLNRSKGARSPDEWLPPSGQCGYVARFVRIVKQYNLKPTKPEAQWLNAFLERCRS